MGMELITRVGFYAGCPATASTIWRVWQLGAREMP